MAEYGDGWSIFSFAIYRRVLLFVYGMNRIPLYLFLLWEEDDEARVRRSYICMGRLMGLTWTLCRGQRHRKQDFTNLAPRVFSLLLEVAKRPWERGCRFTCCGNPPQFPQVLFGCHRIKVIVPDVQTRRKSARKHCSSPIFFSTFLFRNVCLKCREMFLLFLAWYLERSEVLAGCYCCRFWSVFKAYGRFLSEGSHLEFCTTTSA